MTAGTPGRKADEEECTSSAPKELMLTTEFWCSGPNKDWETSHPEARYKQEESFFVSM